MNLTKEEEQVQRDRDLFLLEFILSGSDRVTDQKDVGMIQGMLAKLLDQSRHFNVLSRPQRNMILAICRQVSPSGEGWKDGDELDPAERNKNVPRGNPVETLAVLKNLPKKPPGRRY